MSNDVFDQYDIDVPTEEDINYMFDGREYEQKEDAVLARRRKAEQKMVSAARELVANVLGPEAPNRLAEQFSDKAGETPAFDTVVMELLDDANFDPKETGSARVLLGQILTQAGKRITQGNMTLDVGEKAPDARRVDEAEGDAERLDSLEGETSF